MHKNIIFFILKESFVEATSHQQIVMLIGFFFGVGFQIKLDEQNYAFV